MGISQETINFMLDHMLKIRRFEEKLKEIHRQSVPGLVHLYIGEEAVAVGVCANLTKTDIITSTHRGHGHTIAKGASLKHMMAELFAKETGLCKGKGGSMHVADANLGILGANGIVSGGVTLATGAALAAQMKGDGSVAVCFFGDGAANQGGVYESMNLASAWHLPVIFVCENNLYHEFSPSGPVTAGAIADRAAGFGMPGYAVDGMDVLAMYQAGKEAVARARQGEGPTLLEAKTYRFEAHDEGEFALIGTTYRTEAEVAAWQARDPIVQFKAWIVDKGHKTEAEIERLESQIQRELEEAVAFAESSPLPSPEQALEDIFAE